MIVNAVETLIESQAGQTISEIIRAWKTESIVEIELVCYAVYALGGGEAAQTVGDCRATYTLIGIKIVLITNALDAYSSTCAEIACQQNLPTGYTGTVIQKSGEI